MGQVAPSNAAICERTPTGAFVSHQIFPSSGGKTHCSLPWLNPTLLDHSFAQKAVDQL